MSAQVPDRDPAELTAREQVVCPREKSWMTPCVARDGALALADDMHCVGCGIGPAEIADEMAAVVRRYLDVKDAAPTGDGPP